MPGHQVLPRTLVKQIRQRMLLLIEERADIDRWTVVHRTQRARSTVDRFLGGLDHSSALASRIIRAFPELNLDATCPCCGRPLAESAASSFPHRSGIIPDLNTKPPDLQDFLGPGDDSGQ